MYISPIRGGFNPNQAIISRKKTTSKRIKASIKKSVSDAKKLLETEGILIDDVFEAIVDDPDSSREMWKKDNLSEDFKYDESFIYELYLKSIHINHALNTLSNVQKRRLFTPIQSLQHFTLPEAILFYYLTHKKDIGNFKLKMSLNQIDTKTKIMQMDLDFFQKNKVIESIDLNFYFEELKTEIFKGATNIGHAKYIIRNRKLEEIIGEIYSRAFILDPIWNSNSVISNEKIKIAGFSDSLIRRKNTKVSGLDLDKLDRLNLDIKKIHSSKFNAHSFMTTKETYFRDYKVITTLIFLKYIVMPVGAVFNVEKLLR